MRIKKHLAKSCALFCAAFLLGAFPCIKTQAATVYTPQATGAVAYNSSKVSIDVSNASQGYVMIKYTGSNPKVKIQITKNTTYTYDIANTGSYVTFPFSEGSGAYTIKVYENVSGNSYAQAASQTVSVSLADELIPFLYPNQFCDFHADSAVVAASDTLAGAITDPVAKVSAIYDYVVTNFTYDFNKAATVRAGYLPVVDDTLATKTGICFDYAAVMTSMLRAQGVPTKLVIGYAGSVYHAWVSVYAQGQGWIDNIIYFDGISWKFMDPTFASSGQRSAEIQSYISNPANYKAKFSY